MPWFDATQIDPAQGSSQLPVGQHRVIAIDSNRVAVKDKPNEHMLRFNLRVIDGQFAGSVGNYNLNLWNAAPQATEIAAKQLSALCHVTGTMQLNDQTKMGSELFNKPFRVVVTPQDDPKYTQISAVPDDAGNPPVKQAVMPMAQQQAPSPGPQGGQFIPPGPQGGQPQMIGPQHLQGAAPGPAFTPPGQVQPQGGFVPPGPQQQVQPQQPQFAPQGQMQPQGGQPQWSQQPGGTGQPGWVR